MSQLVRACEDESSDDIDEELTKKEAKKKSKEIENNKAKWAILHA